LTKDDGFSVDTTGIVMFRSVPIEYEEEILV
jgi:hypothetical protein